MCPYREVKNVLAFIFRPGIKWREIRDSLDELSFAVSELAEEITASNAQLLNMIREERDATSKRLTWLEDNLWNVVKS